MPRYFLETSYKGTAYAGFQVQKNAHTIQSEIEKALKVFFKTDFSLTGASRTDAGVHALQNYFHFDAELPLFNSKSGRSNGPDPGIRSAAKKSGNGPVYNLNAILPPDIVIKRIFQVEKEAHCRFDAVSREYQYVIFSSKDPFLDDRAYFYPYPLDRDILNEAADMLLGIQDFTSFSKRNTQVSNFVCHIQESRWIQREGTLVYQVKGNRFLRGMVKGLVGTMLKAGTGRIGLKQFHEILQGRDSSKADFSVPAHALFLIAVQYEGF